LPKRERETARCFVAALADIPDIRFSPLRAAHRFRRLCVQSRAAGVAAKQVISGTGH
jgi:hypothetical protein